MNYIGIDIGDGESCVCVLPSESQIEPRPLMITGRRSFISAVAKDSDDQVRIGMDALNVDANRGLSVRFKSRFLTDQNQAHEDMRHFLSGIQQVLQKEGLFEQECSVSVGCPAGWDAETREEYLRLIRAAGFPSPRLVSESRAAFLYAKHARTIQLESSLIEESALVVDIGSSTLDFAYVVHGRETNVGTFGDVYLGGGAIDEALLKAAVDQSDRKAEIMKTFKEAPEWRSYCLLAARRLKEEYFTREADCEKNIYCGETLTLMYDDPLPLVLSANQILISRVVDMPIRALNGKSFRGMLNAALEQASAQTRKYPPRLVLLTGGASRMRFFQELCKKHFPNAHFVLCDEPELSIAKGLAYSARVDDRIHAFNAAVDVYLTSGAIHEAVSGHMRQLIEDTARCMADIGFDEAKLHVASWQNGNYANLQDMFDAFGKALGDRLQDSSAAKAVSDIVQNAMNEICASLQPEIDEMCMDYGIDKSQMQLFSINTSFGKHLVSTLGVEGDMRFLTKTIQALITAAAAAVLLLIPGGGIVDLLLIAITASAAILGKDSIDKTAKKIDIPVFLRKKIPIEKICSKSFLENLYKEFHTRLENDEAFRSNISSVLTSFLTDYVSSMAQKTEIAIS